MKVGCGWLWDCLPRAYVAARTATGMTAVYR